MVSLWYVQYMYTRVIYKKKSGASTTFEKEMNNGRKMKRKEQKKNQVRESV